MNIITVLTPCKKSDKGAVKTNIKDVGKLKIADISYDHFMF